MLRYQQCLEIPINSIYYMWDPRTPGRNLLIMKNGQHIVDEVWQRVTKAIPEAIGLEGYKLIIVPPLTDSWFFRHYADSWGLYPYHAASEQMIRACLSRSLYLAPMFLFRSPHANQARHSQRIVDGVIIYGMTGIMYSNGQDFSDEQEVEALIDTLSSYMIKLYTECNGIELKDIAASSAEDQKADIVHKMWAGEVNLLKATSDSFDISTLYSYDGCIIADDTEEDLIPFNFATIYERRIRRIGTNADDEIDCNMLHIYQVLKEIYDNTNRKSPMPGLLVNQVDKHSKEFRKMAEESLSYYDTSKNDIILSQIQRDMVTEETYKKKFKRSEVKVEIEEWLNKYRDPEKNFDEFMRNNALRTEFEVYITWISDFLVCANVDVQSTLEFKEFTVLIDNEPHNYNELTRSQVLGLCYYIYSVFNYSDRKKQVKELLRAENNEAYLEMHQIIEKRASILRNKKEKNENNVQICQSDKDKAVKGAITSIIGKNLINHKQEFASIYKIMLEMEIFDSLSMPQFAEYINYLVDIPAKIKPNGGNIKKIIFKFADKKAYYHPNWEISGFEPQKIQKFIAIGREFKDKYIETIRKKG